MIFPGRPRRLDGFDYSAAGPLFHCRLVTVGRAPAFADSRLAEALVDALVQYHESTLRVYAFCVMPDHVHLLIALRDDRRPLSGAIGDLKRWVKRRAVAIGVELAWQRGFFERVIRSDDDVRAVARYIGANPVRAGLVEDPRAYRFAGSLAWDLWGEAGE